MGIIINGDYDLGDGLIVRNPYVSVASGEVMVRKEKGGHYSVQCYANMWSNETFRQNGGKAIKQVYIYIKSETPPVNVYELIYEEIKTGKVIHKQNQSDENTIEVYTYTDVM
jgi:hypothetical protein